MTDEEAQRAMEEETPVAIDYALRTVVGIVLEAEHSYLVTGRVLWVVRAEGVRALHESNCLRLATAEELLVEGDE